MTPNLARSLPRQRTALNQTFKRKNLTWLGFLLPEVGGEGRGVVTLLR